MSTTPTSAITNTALLALLPASATPDPLDHNPAAVYLASLGAGSRPAMRGALNAIGKLLGVDEALDADGRDMRCLTVPWASLRYQHTAAIRAALQDRYAPATANRLLTALRRVLKEARRLGQISADDYDRAVDLRTIRAHQLPRGRLVTDGEVAALFEACAADRTPAGARDAALIALLRGSGLRRSEVVALNVADYERATGAVTIRAAKGRKDRTAYAPPGTRAALEAWLSVRGDKAGPLFYGLVKGGRLVERRLAAQAIAVICAGRAEAAGVAPFTPHDMRRTFISGLLDAGADVVTVQRLVGHEDPATTSRYDRRGEAAKQRVIALVFVPYAG